VGDHIGTLPVNGKACTVDIDGGDGGGDGVVDVDRNVGPRGVEAAESDESLKNLGERSKGCDIGRAI
jgi:hypothetical protein